ncbi:hypothetical protein BOVA115_3187 [Bacteroides ovatus]|nr:hypothetical protein BOVA115_3187 [Bacteroides ovatus]
MLFLIGEKTGIIGNEIWRIAKKCVSLQASLKGSVPEHFL